VRNALFDPFNQWLSKFVAQRQNALDLTPLFFIILKRGKLLVSDSSTRRLNS